MTNVQKPDVTGGCLCGAVLYKIEFPTDIPFPPDVSSMNFFLS